MAIDSRTEWHTLHSSWRQATANYWATRLFATASITYVGQTLVEDDIENLNGGLRALGRTPDRRRTHRPWTRP